MSKKKATRDTIVNMIYERENGRISKRQLDEIVVDVLDAIIEAVEENGRVVFRGFGEFTIVPCVPRKYRTPSGQTGCSEAKNKLVFRAGDNVTKRLNDK